MVFLVHFGLFWKKRGVSLLENHQEMASRYHLRQFRDLYVYDLQHIEREIARLGGITKFQTLKQTGDNFREISLSVQQERVFIGPNSNHRATNRIKCVHKEGGELGKSFKN